MANRFFSPAVRSGDPLMGLYRDMNRLFDDAFLGNGMRSTGAMPSLDIHEEDNGLCVSAELPGVKPGDVDVRLDGDVLTISGEKRAERSPEESSYHVMERSYGRFSRTVQLPFRPDPDSVDAHFDDGVLTVHLARNPQQQGARRIEVRSGDGHGRQLHASGGSGAQMGGAGSRAGSGGSQMAGSASSASSQVSGSASAGGSQMSGSSSGGSQMSGSSSDGSHAASSTGGETGLPGRSGG